MRDALLTLLILAVGVSWFSFHGPVVGPEERGLGPGENKAGESPLAVSGPGAEIVTVTQSGERETEDQWGREREEQAGEPDDRQEPGEECNMDNLNELISYAVGVMTVLIGEFAGVVVAGTWHRLHKENKEEKK